MHNTNKMCVINVVICCSNGSNNKQQLKNNLLGHSENAKFVANVHIWLRLNAGLITTITFLHLKTKNISVLTTHGISECDSLYRFQLLVHIFCSNCIFLIATFRHLRPAHQRELRDNDKK